MDGDVLQPADPQSLCTPRERQQLGDVEPYSLLSVFLHLLFHPGDVGLPGLHVGDRSVPCGFATIRLQDRAETVPQRSPNLKYLPGSRCGTDLVLQSAAVPLLLLYVLLQPKSVLPGGTQLHFGFPVILRQHIQQVFGLRDGEIPFPDGLLVLCKFLGELRASNVTSHDHAK